ncbi:MAG TPA: hypothetical protein VFS02_13825 [Telluria sp.]|nr:hypothetical protein [Telluria sp.]
MLSHDRLSRFSRMERDGEQLRGRFEALTAAHRYFHGPGALKSISVSDPREDGSIDVVFLDVRIRFQLLMIFSDRFEPRGRVICTHRHAAYGDSPDNCLGAFTFDVDGVTDLDSGVDGQALTLQGAAPQIVLAFLERAIVANRCL